MEQAPNTCSQENDLIVCTRKSAHMKPKKKRVRNRARNPRPIQQLGARPFKSERMVKIGWEREEDFQEEAYLAIEAYLLARKCRVKRRPQDYTTSSGQPDRTLFVWLANTKQAYEAIKQQVSRMNCGMSTWIVYSDPGGQPDKELLKGA